MLKINTNKIIDSIDWILKMFDSFKILINIKSKLKMLIFFNFNF